MTIKRILATIFIAGGVIILCALGKWQLDRLAWKNEITARLAQEYKTPPSQETYDSLLTFNNTHTLPLKYIVLNGTVLNSQSILLGPKPRDGLPGYDILTPMKISGGVILLHRGWANEGAAQKILQMKTQYHIRADGIARRPDYSRWAAQNSPKNNIWMQVNINDIKTAKQIKNLSPLILYVQHITPEKANLTTLHTAGWMPRNKHQQYALFWFSMAGILLIFPFLSRRF